MREGGEGRGRKPSKDVGSAGPWPTEPLEHEAQSVGHTSRKKDGSDAGWRLPLPRHFPRT